MKLNSFTATDLAWTCAVQVNLWGLEFSQTTRVNVQPSFGKSRSVGADYNSLIYDTLEWSLAEVHREGTTL